MALPPAAPPDAELEAGRLLFARPWAFTRGCVDVEDLPPADAIEVAFAGRSNVGKSSLINALTAQNTLARTSNAPGRTRQINLFESPGAEPRLVDLPGYGYARAPKRQIGQWSALIDAYLAGRPNLRRVFLLIDARRGIQGADQAVMDRLDAAAVSYQIVVTKADKCGPEAREQMQAETARALARRPAAHPDIVVTSARDGAGIDALRVEIARLV